MAPQNPPKGPDAPAVLELANTKELGPYWTKITLSRRRGSQPTPPLTNTQDQTEHTSCSNQKLPPSELASKSNTREKQKPQECNQSHKEEESESDGSKMSSSSKTRLPKAAATYDLGIQDPELRQEIDASLLHNGHIATIEKKLDHALSASAENWTDLIKKRCQELLRSGEAQTFDECLVKILADVRADTLAATSTSNTTSKKANGVNGGLVNGNGVNGVSKEIGRGEGGKSLAVPKKVVEEGLKVTRECLELVCKEEDEE